MTEELIKNGLCQSTENPCVFYKTEGQNFLYCSLHVDDMVIVSSDNDIEERYMKNIGEKIDIKNLGNPKCVLGMQIEQENGKIYVHQRDYIKKLLLMYGTSEYNTVSSPIDINAKMDKYEDSKKCDTKDYIYISSCVYIYSSYWKLKNCKI